jgi:hypothetical protein
MHPISKTNFGSKGVQVSFYNGSAVVNGYIVKQLGVSKYSVTDGTVVKTCTLAQTSAQVSGIGSSNPTLCTIPIESNVTTARGATFTPTYGLDVVANNTFVSGGTGAANSNAFTLDGGVRALAVITITNYSNLVASSSTVTVAGTTFTWISGASSGTNIQIGTSNNTTAANLQTALALGTPNTVYSYVSGNIVYVYARATSTASITVSTNAATAISYTSTGNSAAIAGTPASVTVTASSGVVSALASVSAVGAWTTLTSGNVTAYYAGYGVAPILIIPKYSVVSIATSGGTGYVVGQTLSFVGQSDITRPSAHISAVSSGAPSTIVVDYAGSGITKAPSSIGVYGATEHAKVLYDSIVQTVEGNRYYWNLGSSFDGSAVVSKYS